MLQKTRVKLELLSKEKSDIYLTIEESIRGGITSVVKRKAEAKDNTNSLLYLDANNLYGWAMSQELPYGDFKFMSGVEQLNCVDLNRTTANVLNLILSRPDGIGYTFKCDIVYPENLHDNHSDLPFLPERKEPTEDMLSPTQKDLYAQTYGDKKFKSSMKLIPNLENKKDYITHYVNLQQAIENGLKVKKVHKIIQFRQKAWMKPYIDYNTEKRKHAVGKFAKDFYKLMNNSVFGKTMENVRKHCKHKIITDGETLRKYTRLVDW